MTTLLKVSHLLLQAGHLIALGGVLMTPAGSAEFTAQSGRLGLTGGQWSTSYTVTPTLFCHKHSADFVCHRHL